MAYISPMLTNIVGAVKKASINLNRDFSEIERLQNSIKGSLDFTKIAFDKIQKGLRVELGKVLPTIPVVLANEKAPKEGMFLSVSSIEGLANFAHGNPDFAISVALINDSTILAGVIYNPARDELFFAEKGKVESVNSLLAQLADLTLFTEIAAPVGNAAVGKIINDKAPKFGGLLDLTALSEEEWKNDFESLVAIAQNVYEICGFNFKTSQIDFVELSGPAGQETLELLFGLNLLGGNKNKTDLVAAALVQFKVLDQETVDELDFSNVVWLSEEEYSEVNVFKQLFALVARISKLEGVDLANLKFDYNEILSRDDSYELIVDVLDVVVESELVLELLPSVLDKYVVPLVKKHYYWFRI